MIEYKVVCVGLMPYESTKKHGFRNMGNIFTGGNRHQGNSKQENNVSKDKPAWVIKMSQLSGLGKCRS